MNMDKPLRRVTIFGLLLILALMVQVNYIQGGQAEKLQEDKLNNRQFLDVFKRPRGKILAGDVTLASSSKIKDKETYARSYGKQVQGDGKIFSPITGYFNGGASSIELAYNTMLDGRNKEITNDKWFDNFIGKPADGADVETTIMPQAQRAAYRQLVNSTNRRAGVAVIDIRTGAIVVLASFPSYDPNEVAPQLGTKGGKRLEQLDKDDKGFKPLVNKAMEETFPPGSSFKTVIAALAMEDKNLNTQSSVPTGALILPESGKPLPNSHDTGSCAGSAPLLLAYAESCNTTFGRMALEMGAEKLHAGAGKFGFGKRIEIEPDLSSASSEAPDKEPNGQPLGKDNLGRSGIGQSDVRATPLQMAMVAASVANKGKIMKPYLVQRVRAADQREIYTANPQEFAQPIKEDTADQLKQMMAEVVKSGTAKNLQGRNIAGKTGTAETGRGLNDNWFVGYSPIDNPRYAFALVTETPSNNFAATAAGPPVGEIMRVVNSK